MKVAAAAAALVCLASWSHALSGRPCCREAGLMRARGFCPNATSRINIGCESGHFLLKDIIVTADGLTTRDTPDYIFSTDENQFCVGNMSKSSEPQDAGTVVPVAVVCFQHFTTDAADAQRDILINGILTLVSTVFLVLTLAVYMFLPQLRDLQGMCIMCTCACMAIGFLSLGIMQLGYNYSREVCALNGYLIYFWLMATFFWMNVISFNMFRSVTQSSYLKKTETRQFLYYSLYAWGCTAVFIIVVLVTNSVEGQHIRPGIGDTNIGGSYNCWFQGVTETWVFFYGPLAVLIAANVALFVLTSLRIWKTAKNYEVSTLKNLKYKFLLYLKLFIVMGLSWVFEIASFAHAQSHIVWRIADLFNCLQGVVFFLLLVVFRRRALAGLTGRGAGGAPARWLLRRLYPCEEEDEADNIVESEHDPAAPYNVNLNN